MIKVMFYHKFKSKITLFGVNTSKERYAIPQGNGKVVFSDLSESDYRCIKPVPFVVTSLPALQAAGINPQELNVNGLLDPTNVGSMQRISEKLLSDFALHYDESNVNPLDNVN